MSVPPALGTNHVAALVGSNVTKWQYLAFCSSARRSLVANKASPTKMVISFQQITDYVKIAAASSLAMAPTLAIAQATVI